jgi:HSP20 family protein
MAINRYDPFRELVSLQDQLFRTFNHTWNRDGRREDSSLQGAWSPLVDVYENTDGIVLKVELPEVNPADVDIQMESNTLTIKGERKLEFADQRDGYHRIERTYGAFSRSFTLPATVDAEHVNAEFKDGVLRVFLPKRAETKPRQIKIAANTAKQ